MAAKPQLAPPQVACGKLVKGFSEKYFVSCLIIRHIQEQENCRVTFGTEYALNKREKAPLLRLF
jgi:hypothetical protein